MAKGEGGNGGNGKAPALATAPDEQGDKAAPRTMTFQVDAAITKALGDLPGGMRGEWIREAIRRRLKAEGAPKFSEAERARAHAEGILRRAQQMAANAQAVLNGGGAWNTNPPVEHKAAK